MPLGNFGLWVTSSGQHAGILACAQVGFTSNNWKLLGRRIVGSDAVYPTETLGPALPLVGHDDRDDRQVFRHISGGVDGAGKLVGARNVASVTPVTLVCSAFKRAPPKDLRIYWWV
jgi:hypothetical protein